MRVTARLGIFALACTVCGFGLARVVWAQAAPDAAEKGGGKPVVILSTSQGDIKVELDSEKAPITVENFLGYVDDGFFDGTIFHRVIPGFMIQGGGFDREMEQEGHPGADQERGGQRPLERSGHPGDGAHQRCQQRDRSVLHQPQGQRLPEPRLAGFRIRGVRKGRGWDGSGGQDRCDPDHQPEGTQRRPHGAGRHQLRAARIGAAPARQRPRRDNVSPGPQPPQGRLAYIPMPPMSGMPPPGMPPGMPPAFFSGFSATVASVVSSRAATLAAF